MSFLLSSQTTPLSSLPPPPHLQRVRRDLVGQPDAAPLLLQVDDEAAPRGDAYHFQGQVELVGAVTLQRPQHLGREARVVHAQGNGGRALGGAGDDGGRLGVGDAAVKL